MLNSFIKTAIFLQFMVIGICFSNPAHAILNRMTHHLSRPSKTVVTRIAPTYGMVLTSINEPMTIDEQAAAIIEMIENSPANKNITVVLEPSDSKNESYEKLLKLIDPAAETARLDRNIKVDVLMVNYKLIEEVKSYLNSLHHYQPGFGTSDTSPILSMDNVPRQLVQDVRNGSRIRNLVNFPARLTRSAVSAIKSTSFAGLAVATGITATGFTTVEPSWVFVGDGTASWQMIASFAASVGLLNYSIRNYEQIAENYETIYDALRTPGQGVRAQIRRWMGRASYLSPANPISMALFNASASIGVAVGIQSAFYILQDGTLQGDWPFVLKNAILIGAASSPWTFLSEKLSRLTNMSEAMIRTIRFSSLIAIGVSAAGITNVDSMVFNPFAISNPEEATLLGIGFVGLVLQVNDVKLFRKLDQNVFWRQLNYNIEALGTLMEKIFTLGRRSGPSRFVSKAEVIKILRDETRINNGEQIENPRLGSQELGMCSQFLSN